MKNLIRLVFDPGKAYQWSHLGHVPYLAPKTLVGCNAFSTTDYTDGHKWMTSFGCIRLRKRYHPQTRMIKCRT